MDEAPYTIATLTYLFIFCARVCIKMGGGGGGGGGEGGTSILLFIGQSFTCHDNGLP